MFTTLVDTTLFGTRVVLDAYPTLLYSGAILGIALALLIARAHGLPLARSAVVFGAASLAAPVGARALHVFTDASRFAEDPSAAYQVALTGFGIYGGLIAAVVVSAVGARLAKVDVWRLADAAAPGIALALALAKLACFCEGCCHGVLTGGALGVGFPYGSPAHIAQLLDGSVGLLGSPLPVLPVQLFEVGGALVLGVLAWVLADRLPDGVAFLGLAAGFSAVRLLVLQYRWVEPNFSGPGWFYPALYVGVIAVCSVLIGWRFAVIRSGVAPTETPAAVG